MNKKNHEDVLEIQFNYYLARMNVGLSIQLAIFAALVALVLTVAIFEIPGLDLTSSAILRLIIEICIFLVFGKIIEKWRFNIQLNDDLARMTYSKLLKSKKADENKYPLENI